MTTILTASSGIYQWKEGASPKRLAGLDRDGLSWAAVSPDGKQAAIVDYGDWTIHSFVTNTSKKVKVAKNANLASFSHDSKVLFFTTSCTPPSKNTKEYVVKAYSLSDDRIESTFHSHPSEITSLSVSANTSYVLSLSSKPPRTLLLDYHSSKSTTFPVETLLKFAQFHPTRQHFLALTAKGDLTCYSVTSKKTLHTFPVRGTTAVWWKSYALVACDDFSVKAVSFEERTILFKFQIGALATCISAIDTQVALGLTSGGCELWKVSESIKVRRVGECVVGKSPVINVHCMSNLPRSRPVSQIEDNVMGVGALLAPGQAIDNLDVFSPLKRKGGSDVETAAERKEKRLKESIASLTQSTSTKRFSGVIDLDRKKDKSPVNTIKRDDLRVKERDMEKDAAQALSHKDKSNSQGTKIAKPLQPSSKDNLPTEKVHPRKSILKNTIRETVLVETTKDTVPPIQLQKRSPSPRKSPEAKGESTSLDTLNLPELEQEFTPHRIRRKSHSPEKSRSIDTIRTISPHPASSKKSEPESNDIWSTAAVPLSRHNSEKRAASPRKDVPESNGVPADLSSTVMEIQTSLRRDIERLRLDMLRQFVTFRNEIGQKWEGEVDRLRVENESLKVEVEKLKKERSERSDERTRWKLM